MINKRIFLSPPNVGSAEISKVASVMESGWVAPIGSSLDEFESLLSNYFKSEVLTVNSGTSALHLSLMLAGVKDGDQVIVSSHTFAACANVVLYERAVPIFIDSEPDTGNLDPELLKRYLEKAEVLPKAIIVTHIYGVAAKMKEIVAIAQHYGIKVIEDAAESLGTMIDEQPAGSFSDFGIVSFNGNKIVTTSAGGALICTKEHRDRALFLASQANSGKFGYDHHEVGYNYRMSNVLAGIGIEQFNKLEEFVDTKRRHFDHYQAALKDYLDFQVELNGTRSNRWLSVGSLKNGDVNVQDLIEFLDSKNIETRRFWKPLHLHDAYKSFRFVGGGVSEGLFEKGICLPSGTGLNDDERNFVIDNIKLFFS